MVFKSFVLIAFWVAMRTEEVRSPFYTTQWQKPKMTSENVAGFTDSPTSGPAFQPLVAAQAHPCVTAHGDLRCAGEGEGSQSNNGDFSLDFIKWSIDK